MQSGRCLGRRLGQSAGRELGFTAAAYRVRSRRTAGSASPSCRATCSRRPPPPPPPPSSLSAMGTRTRPVAPPNAPYTKRPNAQKRSVIAQKRCHAASQGTVRAAPCPARSRRLRAPCAASRESQLMRRARACVHAWSVAISGFPDIAVARRRKIWQRCSAAQTQRHQHGRASCDAREDSRTLSSF